jgi:hypothetical protein
VLREEWDRLDTNLLPKLAYSMHERCQAVIANQGHKAPY